MMEDLKGKKRGRDELEEAELEVKRLRENLLDSLDDEAELCAVTQDLDSFMKSFEEEIVAGGEAVDLGYLLEASDDELGLPPTASEGELVRSECDSSELGSEFWEAPGYDSFEFGLSGSLDGLFDYSDLGFGSGDFGWRPETLPAQ